MPQRNPNLVWKRSTMEEQEMDVLRYSISLSPRERLCMLSELQKRAYPEIYADHKSYYKRSIESPIVRRKIDWYGV